MRRLVVPSLLLSLLVMTSLWAAQRSSEIEKPVWTLEFIKPKPGMLSPTLDYLDADWMHVREEAKRQGHVLEYQRLVEQETPGNNQTIILITVFKDQQSYLIRDGLFASIRSASPQNTPGAGKLFQKEDLYDAMGTKVFENQNEPYNPRFRLLSKN